MGETINTAKIVTLAKIDWEMTLHTRFFKPALLRATFLLLISLLTHPMSAQAGDPQVTLKTTLGDIVLELDQERAPQTVRNFLDYVDAGFYTDTLFHRVIEGFMIQGGGFNREYQKKPTRAPISNEAYNGLRNQRYTIAMARTTAPHSATSQFFINGVDNRNLDHTNTSTRGWGYAVFGRVVKGQDVVDAISQVRTGPGGPFSRDVPAEPVVILAATRYQPRQSEGENALDNAIEAVGVALERPTETRHGTDAALPLEVSDTAEENALEPVGQN